MKNKLLRVIASLLIIVSVSLFIYPNISKKIIQDKNDAIIERFNAVADEVQDRTSSEATEDAVVDVDGNPIGEDGYPVNESERSNYHPVAYMIDLNHLYNDSAAYNKALNDRQDMNVDFSDSALDLDDYGIYDGVYGYISAPSISLNIPIYLGASEGNMSMGGAHLMNTSLPLGEESSNVVIAGHTGYFGRVVFDHIPQLSIGDTVSVRTYFDKLNYRVISKKEISATETNDIYITKNKDMLTLITCARMGKSRYEVICERA